LEPVVPKALGLASQVRALAPKKNGGCNRKYAKKEYGHMRTSSGHPRRWKDPDALRDLIRALEDCLATDPKTPPIGAKLAIYNRVEKVVARYYSEMGACSREWGLVVPILVFFALRSARNLDSYWRP
jgi:hypothetical protein